MEDSKKRTASPNREVSTSKKQKKQWRTPKKGYQTIAASIEPGDAGIWATCAMGREGKSTADLRDLFDDYAMKIYGDVGSSAENLTNHNSNGGDGDNDKDVHDIEASISTEINGIKSTTTKESALFQTVKIDMQCVLFFKTRQPVEPVAFVRRICRDAAEGKAPSKCRFVKRLTPMSWMGKASVAGLEDVCVHVLPPFFGGGDETRKKFAIRPTTRNHNTMQRDDVIKQVATAVGPGYSVDLKHPDVVILVDIYKVRLTMFRLPAIKRNGT